MDEHEHYFYAEAAEQSKPNLMLYAVSSSLILLLIAALFGPLISPHSANQVYWSSIGVPPSLEQRPDEANLRLHIEARLIGFTVQIESMTINSETALITFVGSDVPATELLRAIESIDDISKIKVLESSSGKSMQIEALLARHRFLLGTDANGRDLLVRILYALRVSLFVAVLATAVAIIFGAVWGGVAGFFGGVIDSVMMRIVDMLYAIPFAFVIILLVASFESSLILMIIAIGMVEWLDMAKIIRGETLRLSRREFVLAAKALGVREVAIIGRHIIPNLFALIAVYVTLTVPKVVLLESFMSFLGLGVQEPYTSLGVLIADGVADMQSRPHLLVWPTLTLLFILLSIDKLSDQLRQQLSISPL